MSELDILNASSGSDLNPDFPMSGEPDDLNITFRPRVGKFLSRQLGPSPHQYQLTWKGKPIAVANQIRQWYWQYKNSYFTLFDYERNRSFTGNFLKQPQIQLSAFNKWDITAIFIEIDGAPMLNYPSNWGVDSYLLQSVDSSNTPLVKFDSMGSWTFDEGIGFSTEFPFATAEWQYDGYGFRLWSPKLPDCGQFTLLLDGTALGTVDLFDPVGMVSAPVWTQQNVSFGRHRVTIATTGLKNASSTGTKVFANAIEVMI